jgi:hypothetical protein
MVRAPEAEQMITNNQRTAGVLIAVGAMLFSGVSQASSAYVDEAPLGLNSGTGTVSPEVEHDEVDSSEAGDFSELDEDEADDEASELNDDETCAIELDPRQCQPLPTEGHPDLLLSLLEFEHKGPVTSEALAKVNISKRTKRVQKNKTRKRIKAHKPNKRVKKIRTHRPNKKRPKPNRKRR